MQTFTDVIRHRFILSNLVAKEFKALYRSMSLGFLWSLLQPLVLVTVLSTVWITFMGQGKDFASMVLVALIPYNFFTYCLSGSAGVILRNKSLVKKMKFPRQLLPFSVVCIHTIHFAIQSTLIVLVLLLFPPEAQILGSQLLWIPVILLIELGLVIGVSMLVSSMSVVYRDVTYVVESALIVLFWASPILYSAEKTLFEKPEFVDNYGSLGLLYYLNPLAGILEGFRSVLYYGVAPNPVTLGMATVVTIVIGALGLRSFWIHEKDFADLI